MQQLLYVIDCLLCEAATSAQVSTLQPARAHANRADEIYESQARTLLSARKLNWSAAQRSSLALSASERARATIALPEEPSKRSLRRTYRIRWRRIRAFAGQVSRASVHRPATCCCSGSVFPTEAAQMGALRQKSLNLLQRADVCAHMAQAAAAGYCNLPAGSERASQVSCSSLGRS